MLYTIPGFTVPLQVNTKLLEFPIIYECLVIFILRVNFLALMFCIFVEAVEMSDIYQSPNDPEAPRILSSTPR